jgi:hypothetical protein
VGWIKQNTTENGIHYFIPFVGVHSGKCTAHFVAQVDLTDSHCGVCNMSRNPSAEFFL